MNEFPGVIKLLNGDEIIGSVMVCDQEDGFVIENPFSIEEENV